MSNTYRNRETYLKNKREESKRARKRKSEYILEQKKPCLFCSSEENIEFHHINPLEKKFILGKGFNHSWESIDLEIKKCWCLCESCHNKLHLRLLDPLPDCYDVTLEELSHPS
jgi:hypothetical protein